MGESLMRSWLRHTQNCQVAELNWKTSSSWAYDEESAQNIMDTARKYCQEKLGVDIFQGTTKASQLLKQAEIDVLGLELNRQGAIVRVHGVDIAFHTPGLNYSGTNKTIVKVIEKMIRSTIVIRSYFGALPTQVIFASPSVGKSLESNLESAFRDLANFFSINKITSEPRLLINQNFKKEVVDPIRGSAGDIADTSELFLRSIQLLNLLPVDDAAVTDLVPERSNSEVLRIDLEPSSDEVFKAELLKTRLAKIIILYKDGTVEERLWNAQNFSEDSNLRGNIRSRPEFRQGEWQKRGIASIRVKIAA